MSIKEVKIPDIGGATDVDVIEVNVKVGDTIKTDDPLITLESEKASMDIPAPFSGKITALKVKVGDKVSEGDVVLEVEATGENAATEASAPTAGKKPEPVATPAKPVTSAPETVKAPRAAPTASAQTSEPGEHVHAAPNVRRYARMLGADLNQIPPTGEKGRVSKGDVEQFVQQAMTSGGGGRGRLAFEQPDVDFTQFGEVEVQPLEKIRKLTLQHMQRAWHLVPHVTQFDEADITDLEVFRQAHKDEAEKKGFRLTMLAFLLQAMVPPLKAFPSFNASLSADQESLILKKYVNIGVAVDTPKGLVVPVIRDVDQKNAFDLAKELTEISVKARDGKLLPRDMKGGCITISSLGGIGGSAFTPIVNVPEVAILGVSKAETKPVFQKNKDSKNGEGEFVPRLMLPLSLSYDHRVIDGAEAARFCQALVKSLSDIRLQLL